jgi:hypothetical protein
VAKRAARSAGGGVTVDEGTEDRACRCAAFPITVGIYLPKANVPRATDPSAIRTDTTQQRALRFPSGRATVGRAPPCHDSTRLPRRSRTSTRVNPTGLATDTTISEYLGLHTIETSPADRGRPCWSHAAGGLYCEQSNVSTSPGMPPRCGLIGLSTNTYSRESLGYQLGGGIRLRMAAARVELTDNMSTP